MTQRPQNQQSARENWTRIMRIWDLQVRAERREATSESQEAESGSKEGRAESQGSEVGSREGRYVSREVKAEIREGRDEKKAAEAGTSAACAAS